MKKVLKKRILIIIFMAIAIWGMNANKGVKAWTEGNKQNTTFGSITAEKIYASYSGGKTHLKIVFNSEFMTSYGGNYAGIQFRLKFTGETSNLANPSTVSLENAGTIGWKLTERKLDSSVIDGQEYTYIFEKDNLESGSQNVTLNLSFDASHFDSVGDSVTFTIKSVVCSALNGRERSDTSTYVVTATTEGFSKLSSSDPSVQVFDGGVEGGTIRVLSGTTEGITTWTNLMSKINGLTSYSTKKIYALSGEEALQESANVCTGRIVLISSSGSRTRTIVVYVLGDCWQKTGDTGERQININDVIAQRYRAVGYSTAEIPTKVGSNGVFSVDAANTNLDGSGTVDVSDIIRTRKRILDSTWPSQV